MADLTIETISSADKAAILLISLGKEASAGIYQHLRAEEIEQLTLGISRVSQVSSEARDSVLQEFYQMCLAKNYVNNGGIDYAKEILEQAMGSDKAIEIIQKIASTLRVKPFSFIKRVDPTQLLGLLQHERPQTIALVFSYLAPNQAAALLAALPPEKQIEVAERIALIDRAAPEYINEIERVLERRLASMGANEHAVIDGVQAIVDIMNSVDRSIERHIIESLEIQNANLANEIRKRMFVFEDVTKLAAKHIQRVLKDIETSDITLALKSSTQEVKNCIFDNVSSRLRQLIEEDMQFMGPVRLKDVEEAQQRIVNIVRRLEEEGEIIIARGREDEVLV